MLAFVLLQLIFRRTVFTIAAAVVLLALIQAQTVMNSGTSVWIGVLFQSAILAIVITMVVRHGLLVTAIALSVADVIDGLPLTSVVSHWSATSSNTTLAVVITLTLFGFYASRAGQPLFGKIGDMANG